MSMTKFRESKKTILAFTQMNNKMLFKCKKNMANFLAFLIYYLFRVEYPDDSSISARITSSIG